MSKPDPAIARLTPVFAALGDPTRLALIARLAAEAPRSITQLAEGLDQSRQSVTKHLKVLERAGLIQSGRSGRTRRFTCKPQALRNASDYLQAVSEQWDDALARLREQVER